MSPGPAPFHGARGSPTLGGSRGPLILVLAVLVAIPASAVGDPTLTIPIQGSQEVPPTGSSKIGTATIVIHTTTNTLQFTITHDVTGETAAHIHGPAPRGMNAGVLSTMPLGSPKTGTWSYTAAQEADLLAGRIYINIHSTAFPGGEIRGQIDNNGQGVPFPSLGEWGILLLSLTLVATGAVFVVRRRAMA